MKITPIQSTILKMAREKGGQFTKQDAVQLVGRRYYCNEEKHVGDVLSRMVNSGFIVRLKPGLFELSKSRVVVLKKQQENPNQKSLFEL